MPLTKNQKRALKIIKKHGPIKPKRFSQKMWPDSKGHDRYHNTGSSGAVAGLGMWLAGGGYLGKLAKRGWIRKSHKTIGSELLDVGYVLTAKGEAALERDDKDG